MGHNLNYDTFSLMNECDEFLKSYAEMQASMEDLAKEDLKELEEQIINQHEKLNELSAKVADQSDGIAAKLHTQARTNRKKWASQYWQDTALQICLVGGGRLKNHAKLCVVGGAACEPEDADGVPCRDVRERCESCRRQFRRPEGRHLDGAADI